MGVPLLFRWLSRKYPKIISPVVETDTEYSAPNVNGELDNLYLDMNGIVHPCSHPEHKPPPQTEQEMMLDIFKYTDRVLNMARPRKLLMIAVDGVAPRAKMNQQRSRRFRALQEALLQNEEQQRLLQEMELRGELIDDAIKGKRKWDTNQITPGTPFMDVLAQSLRYWVCYKLSHDPGWAQLQVIISDASVPGEGEHKIMNFIRLQRSDSQHDANTTHCIYGLDADLIFLSLMNHEPHFRVLREDVFASNARQMRLKDVMNVTALEREQLQQLDEVKPFLWLHTQILREYLEIELNIPRLQFKFDLERAIDDWVFMCFFVGNDFLPHLPSLDVRDNGIDLLVNIWKRTLPQLKSYITCDGVIDLAGVEKLMQGLALQEDGIFKKRQERELRYSQNQNQQKRRVVPQSKIEDKLGNAQVYDTATGENVTVGLKLNHREMLIHNDEITIAGLANKSAAEVIKLQNDSNNAAAAKLKLQLSDATTSTSTTTKRKLDAISDEDTTNGDLIRLSEPGYRNRYYHHKFHCQSDEDIDTTRKLVLQLYVEGLCWVLLYYTQGCPSWNWYYPYHYAPFALDFNGVADIKVVFNKGTPFKPFEQLMSVMPLASGHTLPLVFRPLMSDADSEIIDFYPEEFEIDMNGKKMSWQGIPLLPFIDEQRLLTLVRGKYALLSEAELDRNSLKQDVLFMGQHHKSFNKLKRVVYDENRSISVRLTQDGVFGELSLLSKFDVGGVTAFPFGLDGEYGNVDNALILGLSFEFPKLDIKGKSMLLTGYVSHFKQLTQEDKDSLVYGNGGANYRYRNQNVVNDDASKSVGAFGDSMYVARVGGYKGWLQLNQYQQQQQPQYQPQHYHNNNYKANSYKANNYNYNHSNTRR